MSRVEDGLVCEGDHALHFSSTLLISLYISSLGLYLFFEEESRMDDGLVFEGHHAFHFSSSLLLSPYISPSPYFFFKEENRVEDGLVCVRVTMPSTSLVPYSSLYISLLSLSLFIF